MGVVRLLKTSRREGVDRRPSELALSVAPLPRLSKPGQSGRLETARCCPLPAGVVGTLSKRRPDSEMAECVLGRWGPIHFTANKKAVIRLAHYLKASSTSALRASVTLRHTFILPLCPGDYVRRLEQEGTRRAGSYYFTFPMFCKCQSSLSALILSHPS